MLDQSMKEQVRAIFENLHSQYELRLYISTDHPLKGDVTALLSDVAEASERISFKSEESEGFSIRVAKEGEEASFSFEAMPTGHEFSTLLLAILNLDGGGRNLPDEQFAKRIQGLQGEAEIVSYVLLSCPNCPDVVQAMNVISILNPNIRHRIVDGALVADEMERLSIQAVPTLYMGDELFHVGRASMVDLVANLEANMSSDVVYEEQDYTFDVVVVGGGPAGVTAAIYAARKGFRVAIVAERIGGQTLETQAIENITSVTKTMGIEYAAKLREQIERYPIKIFDNRKVSSIERVKDRVSILRTSLNENLEARAVIIATGAKWRTLDIEGEEEYIGRGVAFCTHCDAPFYEGRRVVVVGGGNSGIEAAMDLSNIASEVTLVEYAEALTGDAALCDRMALLGNVEVVTNAQATRILGDGERVTAVEYRDRANGEVVTKDVEGVFVQIGLLPNSELFREVVELSDRNEIVVDTACRTSTKGVYAAGDVTIVPYKQIVVAQGEGAKAAIAAFEDIVVGVI